jgi:hypothetical protein
MGCSPSQQNEKIIEVRKERIISNRVTDLPSFEPVISPNFIQRFNLSLFVIGEENSKYEDSGFPSNIVNLITPQMTEPYKDT